MLIKAESLIEFGAHKPLLDGVPAFAQLQKAPQNNTKREIFFFVNTLDHYMYITPLTYRKHLRKDAVANLIRSVP